MYTTVEGTSCNPFVAIEIYLSSSSKVMDEGFLIPKLLIGGKTSTIDKETTIYFNDNR